MKSDSASIALQQKTILEHENESVEQTNSNELNIFETRIVPGEYTLLTDRKFYMFG